MIVVNKIFRYAIGLVLVWCMNYQVTGQAVVEIHFGKQSIQVGDVVSVFLRLEIPVQENGIWISRDSVLVGVNTLFASDSLKYEPFADIEILDYGLFEKYIHEGQVTRPFDTKQEGLQTRVIEDSLLVQFYNPGEFLCFGPVMSGLLHSVASRKPALLTVTLPNALAAKDSLSLQPIKDIIHEPANFMDYLPDLLIVILLILLVIVIFYFLKKRKRGGSTSKITDQPEIPPHERALTALQELRDTTYWQVVGDKDFQTVFTLILRQYISQRFNIPALEMTSSEIISSLKINGLSDAQLFSVDQLLQLADLVKFANASAPESMYYEYLGKAIEFVDTTKQILSR